MVKKLEPPMTEKPSKISTIDPTVDKTCPVSLPAW
jgi:hypothetical protein